MANSIIMTDTLYINGQLPYTRAGVYAFQLAMRFMNTRLFT